MSTDGYQPLGDGLFLVRGVRIRPRLDVESIVARARREGLVRQPSREVAND